MIPAFDEHGYRPPGVHLATLTEIEQRFGTSSEIRHVQFESVVWLVEAAEACDVERIVINGSYVTDAAQPNDVDCVLLIGDTFDTDGDAEQRLLIQQVREEIHRYEAGMQGPSRHQLATEQQLQNSVSKLKSLQQFEEKRAAEPVSSARNLSLLSLRRTMNQLREEIALYEVHRKQPLESTAD